MGLLTNIILAKKLLSSFKKPQESVDTFSQPKINIFTETIKGLPEATGIVGKKIAQPIIEGAKNIAAFVPPLAYISPEDSAKRRKETFKNLELMGQNARRAAEILQSKKKYSQLTKEEKDIFTNQAIFALSFAGGMKAVKKIPPGPYVTPKTGLSVIYGGRQKPMSRLDFESSFIMGKQYGDAPKSMFYQPNGNLQKSYAIGRVNDVAQKLNISFPGKKLGEAFKKSVDVEKVPDLMWLRNKAQQFWKMGESGKSAIPPVSENIVRFSLGLKNILRGTKGMTADDIMTKFPDIKLKRDVPAKDIYGNKVEIPEGEALTPYELKGNKILLQDGETYIVSKNQFQNIKGQSVVAEAKEFAPELKGLEESKKGVPTGNVRIKAEPEGYFTAWKGNEQIGGAFGTRQQALEATKTAEGTTKFSQYVLPGGSNYKEILIKAPSGTYKDPHFGEPTISHLRLNEHTIKGKKITFMEEAQSDWARAVREGKDVPMNPLVQGNKWQKPTVKRALQEAVANDSDYFAWITGEQTSARYNLATQVDNVKWNKLPQTINREVVIRAQDGREFYVNFKPDGVIENGAGMPPDWRGKKLDEVLGKGLADSIMSKESGSLSGEGLKFGGEWATNLYDRQIKNIVEDVTGGKVEKLDMGLPIEKDVEVFRIVNVGKPPHSFKELTPNNIKVGLEVHSSKGAGDSYIITGILGDGKFKAVKKDLGLNVDVVSPLEKKNSIKFGNKLYNKADQKTFDISPKTTTQQGIKLTPEIKARIRGEAPNFKTSGVKFRQGDKAPQYKASVKSGTKLLRKIYTEDEARFIAWDILPKEFGNAYGATEFLWNSVKKKFDVIINVLKKDGKVSQDVIAHEILHPYVELYVDTARKKEIFKEVIAHHGKEKVAEVMKVYQGDKWLAAEELLADDFKEFLRTGKTYSSTIRGFFASIKDFLLKLIGKRGKVEKLFNDILKRKRPSKPITQDLAETKFKKRNPQEIKMELEVLNDVIKNHPAYPLTKFANKNGKLPEVIGQGGKFGTEGDALVTELGFSDSEAAGQAFEDLQELRKRRIELKKEITSFGDDPKTTLSFQEQTVSAISSEERANQARIKLDDSMIGKVSSLDTIVRQKVTGVKAKVNIIDYLRTPEKVLNKIGLGKEAKLIRQGYESYLKELPKNIDKITEWSKRVPKESNERIFKYLDGKEINLNTEEKKVAEEIKDWLANWAERLKLPKDKRITHYITHIFDEQLIAKEFDEDLAKIITDKIPGEIYDPFLLQRLGAKGYKQDTWQALDAYVKRATRKANMDDALEILKLKTGSSQETSKLEISQYKYVQRYVSHINLRPTELDNLTDNAIKSLVGYRLGQRPFMRLTKLLRQMTYRGLLGLNLSSALRNISQGVNTYTVLGEKYTTIGYLKLFNRRAFKELEEQGIFNYKFIQDRQINAVKKTIEKVDKGLFLFFDIAEKINRGAAYFGAKAKALGQGKTPDEAVQYAKEVVRKTQFAFGSIDTPVALQSDIAKTLVQLQTYTVKQIEFLAEMAKDKNFIGLIRYGLAGLLFTYTIGRAFGMEPKDIIPSFRFGAPPSLKFPLEVGKAALNIPDKYGRTRDIQRKIGDITKSLTGLVPAGAQIKKTSEGLKAIKEGGVFDKQGKLQYHQGESTLQKIQAILFGKYASQEAKQYYQQKEKGKSGSSDFTKQIEEKYLNQKSDFVRQIEEKYK